MLPPPTRAEWLGELRGHTSIQYLAWVSDYADELERRRALPSVFLAGGCEPWWRTRLRARFGDGA
jgi:hypothetical protein